MGYKFPFFDENNYFQFPPVEKATPEGIVAVGGNLSPGMLLSAYSQGIFPWPSPGEPLLWWSPDPRYVLFPNSIHISKSMKKTLKSGRYSVTFDKAFKQVIESCRRQRRKGQYGTWITREVVQAYTTLHHLGYAHSVEVWGDERTLTGGLYGISLGACFFGESMFTAEPNCSKIALINLAAALADRKFEFIDCQIYTEHLERMGAVSVPRNRFIELLNMGLNAPTIKGSWNAMEPAVRC